MNKAKFVLMLSCALLTGCAFKTNTPTIPTVYLHLTDTVPIEYKNFPPKQRFLNNLLGRPYKGDSFCHFNKDDLNILSIDLVAIYKISNYTVLSFAPNSPHSTVGDFHTQIINMNSCETLRFDNTNASVSKSEKYISLCEEKRVKILSVDRNLKPTNIKSIPCDEAYLSSNDKWLIVEYKKYIKIYDFNDMKLVFEYYIKKYAYDLPSIFDDFMILHEPPALVIFDDNLQKVIISDKNIDLYNINKLDMNKKEIFYYIDSKDPKTGKYTEQYYYGKFNISTNKQENTNE